MEIVRFGTEIQLVSREQLEAQEPQNKKMKSEYPWQIGNRVSLQKKGFTIYLEDCNALLVHNGNKVVLAHLAPIEALKNRNKVKGEFLKDIAQLKIETKQPLQALIAGGVAYTGSCVESSMQLFDLLKDIVQEAGISQISIIQGAKKREISSSGTHLFCEPKKNKVLITNEAIPLDIKEFKNRFQTVSIHENDTFEIK